MYNYVKYIFNLVPTFIIFCIELQLFFGIVVHIYGCDSDACVGCASSMCAYVDVGTYMFVLCMLVCSAVGALVLAAGCRCDVGGCVCQISKNI